MNGTNHVPVTFWVPDGSCAEGKTHHVGGEVIFIESKRVVPVGTEVTIRLTSSNDALVNWGVAKGIVAWHVLRRISSGTGRDLVFASRVVGHSRLDRPR